MDGLLYILAAILLAVCIFAFFEETMKAIHALVQSWKGRRAQLAREAEQRRRAEAEKRMLLLSSQQWQREQAAREMERRREQAAHEDRLRRPRIEAERFYAMNFELLCTHYPADNFQTFLALEMRPELDEQALWQAYRDLINRLYPILTAERERRANYHHQAALLQEEHERRVSAIRALRVDEALQARLLEREDFRFRTCLERLTDQEP